VRKIVFLDRDGVINNNSLYYTYRCEDFKINDGLIEALQILTNKGFEFIVITNQSGISKEIYTKNDVEMVHQFSKYITAPITTMWKPAYAESQIPF